MDQSYVYADEESDWLTIGKVGHFFKKGWLRMLVYTLVMAIVATIIVLPIKIYYKSENVAVTSIEYVYNGVEEGKDPNGGMLNTDNVISTRVLSDAVNAADLGGVITDIATLREHMRVVGVESEEYKKLVEDAAGGDAAAQATLRDYVFFPTRFDIIVSEPDELGLTDNQVKLLLDKIVSSYFDDFKHRYSVTNMFATNLYTLSANSVWEFVDAYDTYVRALKPITDYINELGEKSSGFVSSVNNTTFPILSGELDTLKSGYDKFSNFVITNDIWRDKATAKKSLEENKTRLTGELASLEAKKTSMADQLANIEPNKIIVQNSGGTQTITEYPKEYWEYQARYLQVIDEINDKTEQLKSVEARLTKFTGDDSTPTPEEDIARAVAELDKIERSTIALIEKVNATVSDYYDSTVVSSAVRQPVSPRVMRMSSDFNIAVIIIVAAAVGLLIACFVTGAKISKANAEARRANSNANGNGNGNADDGEKTDKTAETDPDAE